MTSRPKAQIQQLARLTAPCSVKECARLALTKGMCDLHYRRWKRTGSTDGPRIYKDEVCTVEGCTEPQRERGYCNKHRQRVRIRGTADDPKPRGRKMEDISFGYRMVYRPDHPNVLSNGYIAEHRLVMAEQLGRPLFSDEHVHHRDGDRLNNDPSNLELWTKNHPSGQRASDLVEWARMMKARYANYRPGHA